MWLAFSQAGIGVKGMMNPMGITIPFSANFFMEEMIRDS